jgi:hypothetical protein
MRSGPKLEQGALRANFPTTGSLTLLKSWTTMPASPMTATSTQLCFDWRAASVTPTEANVITPTTEPSPPTMRSAEPEAVQEHNVVDPSLTIRHPDLLQVLPWDFRTSFPEPMEEAILNGTLQPEDAEPENLAALHEEHARHAMTILHDLDAVMDARRMGVDPRSGKAPRTDKQREALEQLFKHEPPRLQREFDILIDVYEEAFGPEAADAFHKAIRAWHAGVEVIGEAPPTLRPLASSIEAGVFGVEDDGSNVDPADDEIAAITSCVADKLAGSSNETERGAVLESYAQDFSQKASDELDRWTRLHAEAVEGGSCDYDPGHPWHYLDRGDAAEPLPLDSISTRTVTKEHFNVRWPKAAAKRHELMQEMITREQTQLADDERRYQALAKEGAEALSQYDREIAHGGDDELAWASAIALKFNHISLARGRIQWLEQQLSDSKSG